MFVPFYATLFSTPFFYAVVVIVTRHLFTLTQNKDVVISLTSYSVFVTMQDFMHPDAFFALGLSFGSRHWSVHHNGERVAKLARAVLCLNIFPCKQSGARSGYPFAFENDRKKPQTTLERREKKQHRTGLPILGQAQHAIVAKVFGERDALVVSK